MRRSRVLGLVLVFAGLVGCAGVYDGLFAAAAGGRTTISGFRAWDAVHVRQITAAHLECNREVGKPAQDACYDAALAPYKAQRDPVLVKLAILAPPLRDAAKVVEQGTADKAVTAALVVRIVTLTADAEQAFEQLKALSEIPDGGSPHDGGH